MNWRSLALVLAGTVIGCAGGAVGHVLATYPPTTPRFQHMCMGPSPTTRGLNDDISGAASQGWELVAVDQGVVCFKRPV